jgi:hypothetical protein
MRRLLLFAAIAVASAAFPLGASAAPGGEAVYADGQSYTMLGVTLITNASPGILAAPPIYILGYMPPAGASGPITLPSGYRPQCNPCLEEPVAYHDHLIPGAPGLGTHGTSGFDYMAPWRIVVMMYNPAYSNSPDFKPITSDDELAAAEANHEFLPINQSPGAPDPYQIWTPNVLVCPIVRHTAS